MEERMENTFYQMYLKELQQITPCTEEEQELLLRRLLSGDLTVCQRLIEGNLFRVLKAAEEFPDCGVLLSDLVQEGNMALTLAVGDYSDGNCGDFETYIESEIRRGMQAAVEEQGRSDQTAKRVLDRVELLNAVSESMAKELGREATVAELAERMQMTEDEVKDIMKMALDALAPKE